MSNEHTRDPLSPRERVRERALRPAIRAASVYGARPPALPRTLRRNPTDAEALLWRHLRNKLLAGLKFRRQQAFGPYVVDFYCHEHALVVEVDGGHHFDDSQMASDETRTQWLKAIGLRILRFTNHEVLTETTEVLERILSEVQDNAQPSP